MAKRRSGNKFLSGLGEGISNASSLLLRSSLQERMQDRYDERAAKSAEATADRATAAQINAAERAIDEKVAAGTLEPTQAEAMKQRLRGQPASGEDIRPSPRRRMEKAVGEGIESATTPEGVYSPESIFGLAEAQGIQSRLPAEWSAGMIPAENDPFQNATPLVREYGERAGAKRRSLETKPTREVKSEDPITGEPRVRMMSDYDPDLRAGLSVGPTAEQKGALKGAEESTTTEVAGPGRAAQKGAEAQAALDVELSPNAINKRVGEAERRAAATETGTINARMANAQKIIDFETKKALAAVQVAATETEFKDWGTQIAKAREAASGAIPIVGELRALWEKAQPEIEALTSRGGAKGQDLIAQIRQGTTPRGMLPTNIRKYQDLLEAARPRLARAMGNVGNFTEGEQARAGFVAPDFLDAANGGKTGYDKLDRIEQLFLAAPSIAQRQRPGSKPMTAEDINAIVTSFRRAKPGDVELGAQPYDILLTPSGSQVRRPGGQ